MKVEAKEEVFLILQGMTDLKLNIINMVNMDIIYLHIKKNKKMKKLMVTIMLM